MPFGWFPMDREFFAVVVTWHIRCCIEPNLANLPEMEKNS